MAKPILISGIQPSGRLHLGNYLGALKNFVALQNSGKYNCFFFIADLHALTQNPNPAELRANTINLAADFLAVGINPRKSSVFLQSQIKAVEELKWILSPLVPVSELMRMTAFKEKIMQKIKPEPGGKITDKDIQRITEESNMGLVEYPVLMAADILLYDAKFVPVGEDQLQHLELARTLARKFNSRFPARRSSGAGGGKTFVEPRPLLTDAPRIMSLDDPAKKMSKSSPAGCIFLDDSPETIKEKVRRAVTDSETEVRYDQQRKPAISNLLRIYASLGDELIPDLEKKFAEMNYSEFKLALANAIAAHFEPFRLRKKILLKKPAIIRAALKTGGTRAGKLAEKKLSEVKKRIGIL